jgi:hypothetical protein
MNAPTSIATGAPVQEQAKGKKPTGLALLREPFPENLISKLPKPTKKQTEDVRADFKKGVRCKICGGWHHPDVVHLDYVGHAALTDRLLDADPSWNWEPVAFDDKGKPMLDENGGMWIKLEVCGVTRLGYGHSDGKRGGDAIKEVIGDALRNAAMRFGAALDLWHKGDFFGTDEEPEKPDPAKASKAEQPKPDAISQAEIDDTVAYLKSVQTLDGLKAGWGLLNDELRKIPAVIKAKDERKAELSNARVSDSVDADQIPY